MLPALICFFGLLAFIGFVMTSRGQELLKGAITAVTAPRDEKRASTRDHQMQLARARAPRKVFGRR
jgi:hypothetical protein